MPDAKKKATSATKKKATTSTATKKKPAAKKPAAKKPAAKKPAATKKKTTTKKKTKPAEVVKKTVKKTTKKEVSKKEKKKAKPVNVLKKTNKADKKPDKKQELENVSVFFPKTKNAKKLQMTEMGRRFTIRPDDAETITKIIKEYVKTPKTKVITDATAGLGGSTINFANNFKSVNAVELNKEHFEMLKNNVGIFKLKNVKLVNDDYVKVAKDLTQDVVFIDAPWGPKKFKFQRLQLSGVPISQIMNDLKGKAKYFVFKVPGNFDFGNFMKHIQYQKVDVRNIPDKRWKVVVVYE